MDIDLGTVIGLISVSATVVILGLSYVGAYMLGQARGRRDAERERVAAREEAKAAGADRLVVVEGAVESMTRAIERLADAHRLAALEPPRPPAADAPLGIARRVRHDTPA